jgi:hypothetical protein
MQPYWQRQTKGKPLYPDLLWSRPENKAFAGRLLIVGGNAQGFMAPADAYRFANEAGIGISRVLVPNALQKTLSKIFPEIEFAPSTPSGSFGQAAFAEVFDAAIWSEGVLLAGDFGRNSETAIMLEQFLDKYDGPVTVTKDAVDYMISGPVTIYLRPSTIFVLSMSQLQKLGISAHYPTAFTLSMDIVRLVEHLHEFTKRFPLTIITKHFQTIVIASDGIITTTKLETDAKIWRLETAAHTATWLIQNPSQQLKALTTAILTYML